MPVKFSVHAKDQLKERKITQSLVKKAVEKPDRIIASYKNRKLRQLLVRGRILEVVTKTEGSRITVITGYFLGEDL